MPQKLSKDQIEAIWFAREAGGTIAFIAERFGLSLSTVSKYCDGIKGPYEPV